MTPGPSSRSFWPAGIVVAFAIFIPVTAGLILLALANRHELTRPDYYEQELRHQRQMDSATRARELGPAASIAFNVTQQRITVVLPAEHARRAATGHVQLHRPSEAGLDRELPLTLDPGGVQTLDVPDLRPGLWKVRVAWTVDGRDYLLEQSLTNLAAAGAGATLR
jgi:nitrogen fixation protein FixH